MRGSRQQSTRLIRLSLVPCNNNEGQLVTDFVNRKVTKDRVPHQVYVAVEAVAGSNCHIDFVHKGKNIRVDNMKVCQRLQQPRQHLGECADGLQP